MSRRTGFERRFEGLDALGELLALTNAVLEPHEVVERFAQAQGAGEAAPEVIPTLFDGEPRFADPEYARRLYQNLLGLWDELAAGRTPRAAAGPDRPRKEKRPPAGPPGPFPEAGPDAPWVEAALGYLGAVDRRGLERLEHAFENRQDALLELLDEAQLSEQAWAAARSRMFRLFCLVELGWPAGVYGVGPAEWKAAGAGTAPPFPAALRQPALEALSGEVPEAAEAEQVQALVERALRALWSARKRG
ncbi:MAG: hypothetical protein FJ086_19280 [Deltaproteobacteria bacterium]|nr:hypothetical protein [Deltaproteobacteria bacterium]